MSSFMAIFMLFVAGLFLGGVISFARNKQIMFAIGCGVAALLALGGAIAWWG